jgi:hypothetical protein
LREAVCSTPNAPAEDHDDPHDVNSSPSRIIIIIAHPAPQGFVPVRNLLRACSAVMLLMSDRSIQHTTRYTQLSAAPFF